MNLSSELKNLLRKTLKELKLPETDIVLEIPPDAKLGDRSCTVALTLARELKRPPREIAEDILNALPKATPFIERIEIAGAGYLNFFLSRSSLVERLQSLLQKKADFGS
ncbi:MAG: hypothetical protein ABH878_03445 [bacterium]